MYFSMHTFCHLYFIIEIICTVLNFTTTKLVYMGFLEYVATVRDSWFERKVRLQCLDHHLRA